MTARMKPFYMMSSTQTAVYVVRITNSTLSNSRLEMAWLVLVFEYGKKYLDFIVGVGWCLTLHHRQELPRSPLDERINTSLLARRVPTGVVDLLCA